MRLFRALLFAVFTLPLAVAALPTPRAQAAVFVSVAITPPAIPVYVQPPIPGPGYVWAPGYWAYGPYGYYWIPGTWVLPPAIGLLWTPGYWGWDGGVYLWHAGYWGPTVGFYGGINYGFGYFGVGYVGGYWAGGQFFYNTAYCNLGGVHVTNVYNRTVANVATTASFHGGPGGTTVQPTAQELAAARDRHVAMTAAQTQHVNAAAANPALRSSVNHGRPMIAATSRPGQFAATGTHNQGPSSRTGTSAAATGHGTVSQPHTLSRTTTNHPQGTTRVPSATTRGSAAVNRTPAGSAPHTFSRATTTHPQGNMHVPSATTRGSAAVNRAHAGSVPHTFSRATRNHPQGTTRVPSAMTRGSAAVNRTRPGSTSHTFSRPTPSHPQGSMHVPNATMRRPTSVSQPHGSGMPIGAAPRSGAPHTAKSPARQSRGGSIQKSEGH